MRRPLASTSSQLILTSTSAAALLLVMGPSFPPRKQGPISMLPGVPVAFSGAPGAPPAPYRAPELARQRQDLVACELKVQHMTRTCNLITVRAAGVMTTASVPGSRCSRKKEQAPRRACSQITSKRSQTPSGATPSGIEASTGVTQTAAPPPVSSHEGASQEVQDMVKSSLTQLGVIPQETPTQSQVQSSNEDAEPPEIEDISSEGGLSDSDQEDPHFGTPALNH